MKGLSADVTDVTVLRIIYICGLYNMYNNGLHNHCYYYYYYYHHYYYYHSYD